MQYFLHTDYLPVCSTKNSLIPHFSSSYIIRYWDPYLWRLTASPQGRGNRHGCDILFSYWAVKCISPSYVQHGNKQHKFVLCDLFVWPRGQVWYFYLFLWWSLIFFHFNWMEVVFLHSFIPEPKLSFQLGLLKYMNLIWPSLVLIYATIF